MNEIPMLKKSKLKERVTYSIDEETKEDLIYLKSHGVDTGELARIGLKKEIQRAKKEISK